VRIVVPFPAGGSFDVAVNPSLPVKTMKEYIALAANVRLD